MQWNVDGFAPIKRYRWEILVKERFKHDDFVAMFKESHEDRVLPYASSKIGNRNITTTNIRLTFIGSAGHKNLRFDIELPSERRFVEVFDCLPKPNSTFWVGIMIGCHGLQSLIRSICDPFWRCKVHVALAKIDAIIGKIRSTGYRMDLSQFQTSAK
jgi:hypothetical protein